MITARTASLLGRLCLGVRSLSRTSALSSSGPQPSLVLQLGHPQLRKVSEPIGDLRSEAVSDVRHRLHGTLGDFVQAHGFGRAISAPQIGENIRMIALRLGTETWTLHNPEITWKSADRFSLYDDCMSFPGLMVRLKRHESISVKFSDEQGLDIEWNNLDRSLSELLQHELDHLNAVLAVDRAEGPDGLVMRSVYEKFRDHFDSQVDYSIPPPSVPK